MLPINIILAFVPRSTFISWLKLAAWMLPLSFFFIAETDVSWAGIGLNLLPFYRDDAARFAAETFSIASLIVLLFASLRSRLRERVGDDVVRFKLETRTLKALFAAGIGSISVAVCTWLEYTGDFSRLLMFLFVGVVSILANLSALYYTAVLVREKMKRHTSFDSKLFIIAALFVVSAIGYIFVLYQGLIL
ncbi:MAG: hypothetical protein ACHQU0_01475 [Candidatus Paceibacteria bacterium]